MKTYLMKTYFDEKITLMMKMFFDEKEPVMTEMTLKKQLYFNGENNVYK